MRRPGRRRAPCRPHQAGPSCRRAGSGAAGCGLHSMYVTRRAVGSIQAKQKVTKRPLTMCRQSKRFTLAATAAGRSPSRANARTAACRFDMSSAAGMPFPATSAIVKPTEAPEAVASKQSPPTPSIGRHVTASRRPSICGSDVGSSARWIRRASSSSRCCFRSWRRAASPFGDLALDDFAQRRSRPMASERSWRRRGAWRRQRCRCCPSRS